MINIITKIADHLKSGNDEFQQITQLRSELCNLSVQHWLKDDIHKWTWWLNLTLTVLPWIIWWKVVDRKKITEIFVYGLLISTVAGSLDSFGTESVYWTYPDVLIPIIPRLLPIDLTVIPVVYMLVYQRYPDWKSFFIVSVIVSGLFSFIAEPILIWLNLYSLVTWKYIYSFPIYIIMALAMKWLTKKIVSQQIK